MPAYIFFNRKLAKLMLTKSTIYNYFCVKKLRFGNKKAVDFGWFCPRTSHEGLLGPGPLGESLQTAL